MKRSMRLMTVVGILALVGVALFGKRLNWTPAARATPTQAPEFADIAHWINSRPLTMKSLRGKVVLIDFWAYSCINCLRTLPYVTHWYDKYKDKGLVVVGVHAPEFDFGKDESHIKDAVEHFHIHYPVAMDNRMATWHAWHNRFWPSEYLVDKQGKVILHHVGEGHYLAMENAIRRQLGLSSLSRTQGHQPDFAAIGSPEMYFGSARERNMANTHGPSATPYFYHMPETLPANQFALAGHWVMTRQYAQLVQDKGVIRLHFKAGKLHMVASSDQPVTLDVTVDGKQQPAVTVQQSRLYTLFDSDDYRDHDVVIKIPEAGLRAFTFTFG